MNDSRLKAEDGSDRFECSTRAEKVSDGTLGRGQRQCSCPLTKDTRQRAPLCRVVVRRPRAVRIDEIDVLGFESGIGQCSLRQLGKVDKS